MNTSPSLKDLVPYIGVLCLLAAAGVLAVVGKTVSGQDIYGFVAVIAGGTAVAGGIALNASTAPSQVIPHLFLVMCIIGLTVAMALENVWGSTQVTGIFGFILGGGSVGAGSNAVTTRLARNSNRPPVPELPPEA